ncbi:MAG: viroplasmin family protein [Bacteroidota bacterium]
MKKNNFYVVWKGVLPGIYLSWEECRKQVEGYKGAMYKGYPTLSAAEEAFMQKPEKIIFGKSKNTKTDFISTYPIQDSIVVDAAWNSVNKDMEYQGIFYKTGNRIFHNGPMPNGTNNIGEFLAIVHALGYCQKHRLTEMPVYSDSRNAITWVKAKQCKTNLEESTKTAHIFDLIKRAEHWLKNNSYKNPVLKWETKSWGENPADFGRK